MDKLAFLTSEKVREFIHQNEHTDAQKLLLNPPTDIKDHINLIADQLISWRKVQAKLPEWYHNRQVIFPPPLSIEQSSSQAAAAYKTPLLSGDLLVDLTGGMGIDCLALSKGFGKTIYVEQNEWLCELFKHNSALLAKKPITVNHTTAEDFLKTFDGTASFYIDPARRDAAQKKVFRFADCTPDLVSLFPDLKKKAVKVLVKAAPLIDLTQGLSELDHVTEIHVLSIKNECKEVLFLIDLKAPEVPEPEIICTNLTANDRQTFCFRMSEEKKIEADLSTLSAYLYDPNASILKAGAFKSILRDFPVKKLAANTHLYTSDQLVADFPGRIFEVTDPNPQKSTLKTLQKANVMTKNFPITANELKRKYKLKDGGEHFLIGYRDQLNKSRLVLVKSK